MILVTRGSLTEESGSIAFTPENGEEAYVRMSVYESEGRYCDSSSETEPLTGAAKMDPISVTFTFDKESYMIGTPVTVTYAIAGGSGSYRDIAYGCSVQENGSLTTVQRGSLTEPRGTITYTPESGEVTNLRMTLYDSEGRYFSARSGDVPLTSAKEEHEHTPVTDEAVMPTCTEPGKTEGKHCSACGAVLEAQEMIPALGHEWDEGKITKEATPDEDGKKTYTCTRCGIELSELIEFVAVNAPKYIVTDATYDKEELIVAGKIEHDATTKTVDRTFARVTFFMGDGSFVAFATVIDDDGSFEAVTSGDVIHVAVQVTDSAKVRPGEYNSYGGDEFDVD